MARTKDTHQAPAELLQILPAKATELALAQDQAGMLLDQDRKNVQALAKQLQYDGPLEPDALEQICFGKALAVERSTFEFGASLLLLRESCLHGDWQARVQRIGVEPRAAHKYMQIALKFSNRPSMADLETLGKTKLLELVVLDDDEVAAFANGETVRGIQFDDVERMSVKELRAKLREAQDETNQKIVAKNRLLAEAHVRINNLEDELGVKFKPEPGSVAQTRQEETLLKELHDSTLVAELAARRLFVAADAALKGDAREAIELDARQAVEYLCQQLVDIATEFHIAVDFETRLQPNWASDEMLAAMEARIAEANAKDKAKPKDKKTALQSVAK